MNIKERSIQLAEHYNYALFRSAQTHCDKRRDVIDLEVLHRVMESMRAQLAEAIEIELGQMIREIKAGSKKGDPGSPISVSKDASGRRTIKTELAS